MSLEKENTRRQATSDAVPSTTTKTMTTEDDKNNGVLLNGSTLQKLKQSSSSFITRMKCFEKLAHWAFTVCDKNQSGRIKKEEFYAGILLVHIEMAKYVGVAACYPPRLEIAEALFDAFDTNQSGDLNQQEFTNILQICAADISSRIAVYFALVVFLVPRLADVVIRSFLQLHEFLELNVTKRQVTIFRWIKSMLSWNQLAETVFGLIIGFLVIPMVFGLIDKTSTQTALQFGNDGPAAESPPADHDKKNE